MLDFADEAGISDRMKMSEVIPVFVYIILL